MSEHGRGAIGVIGGGMLRDIVLTSPVSFIQIGKLCAVAASMPPRRHTALPTRLVRFRHLRETLRRLS